jgi:hypothetical protein
VEIKTPPPAWEGGEKKAMETNFHYKFL